MADQNPPRRALDPANGRALAERLASALTATETEFYAALDDAELPLWPGASLLLLRALAVRCDLGFAEVLDLVEQRWPGYGTFNAAVLSPILDDLAAALLEE